MPKPVYEQTLNYWSRTTGPVKRRQLSMVSLVIHVPGNCFQPVKSHSAMWRLHVICKGIHSIKLCPWTLKVHINQFTWRIGILICWEPYMDSVVLQTFFKLMLWVIPKKVPIMRTEEIVIANAVSVKNVNIFTWIAREASILSVTVALVLKVWFVSKGKSSILLLTLFYWFALQNLWAGALPTEEAIGCWFYRQKCYPLLSESTNVGICWAKWIRKVGKETNGLTDCLIEWFD